MITRPLASRKAPPPNTHRPLGQIRNGRVAKFRPPKPHVPLDPTQAAQARKR